MKNKMFDVIKTSLGYVPVLVNPKGEDNILAAITEAYQMSMNIRVEITRDPKAYVGRIIGISEKYRLALSFLPKERISVRSAKFSIVEPGVYKLSKGAIIGSTRIDTGFIKVTENAEVMEITKNEVYQAGGTLK